MPSSTRTRLRELLQQAIGNITTGMEQISGVHKTFHDEGYLQEAHEADLILQGLQISLDLVVLYREKL